MAVTKGTINNVEKSLGSVTTETAISLNLGQKPSRVVPEKVFFVPSVLNVNNAITNIHGTKAGDYSNKEAVIRVAGEVEPLAHCQESQGCDVGRTEKA